MTESLQPVEIDDRAAAGEKTLVLSLLALAMAANLAGAFNGLFPQDSALYAVVSRQIADTGDWVNLFRDGADWLDKPHFPFWMCAISMRLIGVSVFAYKLPSFLFFALAVLYTYLLAKDLYGSRTARLAALVLAVSMHVVVSNSDVRAEPFLLGLLVGAVFHWQRAASGRWIAHVAAGALFTACAVMTKGPFVVIVAAGAVAGDAVLRRRPRELLRLRWLVAAAMTSLFVLPELHAVYTQFDLHPEKTVFGRTGVSGVRFFLWDSQFGRFANTGPIKGRGDPLFFLHTLLWAFAPWGVVLYPALIRKAWSAWRAENREHVTLSASLPMLLVFSASRFQLPHYTNILFPFFAIMVADWALSLKSGAGRKTAAAIQLATAAALAAGMPALHLFFRPGQDWSLAVFIAAILLISIAAFGRARDGVARAFAVSAAGAAIVCLWVNLAFLPALLSYQACPEAARIVNADGEKRQAAALGVNQWVFEFHSDRPVTRLDAGALGPESARGMLVYTDDAGLAALRESGARIASVQSWRHFDRITRMTRKFLDPATRDAALKNRHLVDVR